VCTFYIENDAEIFPAHYTWKVADKGFKMAFMMNKLAMINSCEIILEKKITKNHCEILVLTILVCSLYLVKYSICWLFSSSFGLTIYSLELQFKVVKTSNSPEIYRGRILVVCDPSMNELCVT
jgi:hypothetical protein